MQNLMSCFLKNIKKNVLLQIDPRNRDDLIQPFTISKLKLTSRFYGLYWVFLFTNFFLNEALKITLIRIIDFQLQ